MAAGIEEARPQYDGSDAEAKKVMILLSDGYNDPESLNDETMEQAEYAADEGITIYTIGLGDGADEELLGDIANETGGEYFAADNSSGLEKIFEGIAMNVTEPIELNITEHDPVRERPPTSNEYVLSLVETNVEIDERS